MTAELVPSLRSDFVHTRLALQPDAKNVSGGVRVAIMRRAARRTIPASHSKTCDTFWASDYTAIGTGLGTQPFAHLNVLNPVPNGFVAEHFPEGGPSGVVNGFSHAGLSQAGCADVAHDDLCVSLHERRRLLVKVMPSRVLNLGVNSLGSPAIASPLGRRKLSGIPGRVAGVLDLGAIGKGRQRLKAQIDAHGSRAGRKHPFDLTAHIEVPAPASILREGADFNLAFNGAGKPEPVGAAKISNRAAIYSEGASAVHGHPSKALAPAPSRASPESIPAFSKLATYTVDGAAMQVKVTASSGRQIAQVNPCGPFLPPSLCMSLDLTTVVPNVVDRPSVSVEMFAGRRILDAVSVGEKHAKNIAFLSIGAKS